MCVYMSLLWSAEFAGGRYAIARTSERGCYSRTDMSQYLRRHNFRPSGPKFSTQELRCTAGDRPDRHTELSLAHRSVCEGNLRETNPLERVGFLENCSTPV